jgi:ABC-type Mn2+/Zn2+ transport system permease subunit
MWQSFLDLLNIIWEPLTQPFMVRALISAVLIGTLCAVMGSYLVVRRLSLLGLVVSNSVVPGIAIAFLLYVNIFVGGFISGILSTVSLGWLQTKTRIKEDAAMGVILSAFFGLGIILITKIQNERKVNLSDFLFGNILGITDLDLVTSAVIGLIVLVTVYALYKEFLLLSFDPQWAEAVGLPAQKLHYTMMALTALTVVATMQSVGVALTIAMLIIPAATAYLLTDRFSSMLQVATALGVSSSVIGLYISYYQNTSSGPTITLVSSFFLLLVVVSGPLLKGTSFGRWSKKIEQMVVLQSEPTSETVPPVSSVDTKPTTEHQSMRQDPVATIPVHSSSSSNVSSSSQPKRQIVRDSNGKLVIKTSSQEHSGNS